MKYQLASTNWDNDEIQAIQDVIKTDQFSMGKKVEEFEKEFAKKFGSKYAVMVNSGSSANLLMVAALFFRKEKSLKRGDEVIVPAVSWSTTYAPLQQYGLHVKFVDIDKDSLNYDLEGLKGAISDNTKAIMAVNLLGNPNDYKAIKEIIGERDIIIIEDNCESLGSSYDNVYTGRFGLMGSFSFFHSHHIVTMEGGAVITDDEELYHIMLCLRSHGWTRHLPENNLLCEKYEDDFVERFRFLMPGYNLRPVEMSGAIGLEQLKKLDSLIEARRDNARVFQDLFSDHKLFNIQKEIGQSSWFGFALILKEEIDLDRKQVVAKLKEANIETRPVVTGNIAKKEMIKKYFDYSIHGSLDNAEVLDQRGFYIGSHSEKIEDKIHYLANVLGSI